MDPRVSFVTLAVADLDASRGFYVDGLGWTPELDVPGEVVMIRVGERVILSLWAEHGFEAEVGPVRRGAGAPPVTLAHNLAREDEVDRVLAEARSAGADPVVDAVRRDWGGYSGYFADPDGYRWEVATNPGPLGQSVLPADAEVADSGPPDQPLPDGLGDWRELGGTFQACFPTSSYAQGVALVDRVAALAEAADHHPELTLGYAEVRLRLWSHDAGAVTERDLTLARRISEAAAELGVASDPTALGPHAGP